MSKWQAHTDLVNVYPTQPLIADPNILMNQQDNTPSASAVAAQAAISGEPVTKHIVFAITGDAETDFIAGVMAVFREILGPQGQQKLTDDHAHWANCTAQRVTAYLSDRFKDYVNHLQERIRLNRIEAQELAKIKARMEWEDKVKGWPKTTSGTDFSDAVMGGIAQAPTCNTGAGSGLANDIQARADKIRAMQDISNRKEPLKPRKALHGKTLVEIFEEEAKAKQGNVADSGEPHKMFPNDLMRKPGEPPEF